MQSARDPTNSLQQTPTGVFKSAGRTGQAPREEKAGEQEQQKQQQRWSPRRRWKLLTGRAARRRARGPSMSPPPAQTLSAPPPPRTPSGGDMTAGRRDAPGRRPPGVPPRVPQPPRLRGRLSPWVANGEEPLTGEPGAGTGGGVSPEPSMGAGSMR